MCVTPGTVLEDRRDAIADSWYRAIRHLSFVPLSVLQVRQHFTELTGQIISFLCAEQVEPAEAEAIGEALVRLRYSQPEVLGRTVQVLAGQLVEGLPAEQAMALQPRLAVLLDGVATGFVRQAHATVLAHQEEIRHALVADLRSAGAALRQAHDQLELQVRQRTRELARANEELRLEIAERKRAESTLRESEEKFRTLAEQSPNMIYINKMGRVVYANQRAEELMGYTKEEYYAEDFDFLTLVAPECRQGVMSHYAAHLQGEEVESYQYTLITKDGRRIEALAATKFIQYAGERALLGIVTDITEQKRVEEALRESEARYRLLLETIRDGIYTLDMEGRITFVNEVILKRSGRSREWFLGRKYPETIRPEDRELARESLEAVMRGEQVPVYEIAYHFAGADLLWLEMNIAALREDGDIMGALGVARDITRRKKTEVALRESEERWRSLVENAPDTVLTVDHDGRILFINRPVVGRSVEEAQGKSILGRGQPEDDEALQAALQRVLETGERQYVEVAGLGRNGGPAWYGCHMGPVWWEGEVVAVMLVARDITDRKRVEEMKDNLIRDVSHELRTPLAKMEMGMELLLELVARDTIDRQRVARVGEVVSSNVHRLLETVEGILDLSALEGGGPAYEMETVQMDDLIDEVVLEMRPLAESKGLELMVQPADSLGPIRGGRRQLYRVLVNLLDNAIKFTEEGRIVVSAQQAAREVAITVSDSGCGILPENVERVFERFYQEKARVAGVGVGLAISQAIVQAHGGRIWVESPGRDLGSTFHIALPVVQE